MCVCLCVCVCVCVCFTNTVPYSIWFIKAMKCRLLTNEEDTKTSKQKEWKHVTKQYFWDFGPGERVKVTFLPKKVNLFTDLLIAVPFQLTITLSLVTPKHPTDVTCTAISQHSHAITNRHDTHLITVTVMISTWICCCGKQIYYMIKLKSDIDG